MKRFLKELREWWWVLNGRCWNCGSWEVRGHIDGKIYCDDCDAGQ